MDAQRRAVLMRLSGNVSLLIAITGVRSSPPAEQLAEALARKVRGVVAVHERSFASETVQFEVVFNGAVDVLANALEDSGFAPRLKIDRVTANTITAALASGATRGD